MFHVHFFVCTVINNLMSKIRSRQSLLASDIARARIEKTVKRTFKLNPTLKLPKMSNSINYNDPRKAFIKELDIELVVELNDPIYNKRKLNNSSSKICMSHILGFKNIKELVGSEEIKIIKRKIRTKIVIGNIKSHLKKPAAPSIVDADMNRRISMMSTQDLKSKIKINNAKDINKSLKIDKTNLQAEYAKNIFSS